MSKKQLLESLKSQIKEATIELENDEYAELMMELGEWCKEQHDIADYDIAAEDFYPDSYDW